MGNCWASSFKYMSTGDTTMGASFANGFILKDGIFVLTYFASADCTNNANSTFEGRCGWLMVDVNGLKNQTQWEEIFFGFTY